MELDEQKFKYVLLAIAAVFAVVKVYGIAVLCGIFALGLLACILSDRGKSKIEQDILQNGRYAIGTVTDVKQEWRTNRRRYTESLVVLIKVDDHAIVFRVGTRKPANAVIGDKVRVKLIDYNHVLAEGDVHNGNFVIYKEATE